MKRLLTALALASALVIPNIAQAIVYVCEATYNGGTSPYVFFNLTEFPDCTGQSFSRYLCHTSLNSSLCAADTRYRYTTTELLHLHGQLARAAADGQGILVNQTTCYNSTATTCIRNVQFKP